MNKFTILPVVLLCEAFCFGGMVETAQGVFGYTDTPLLGWCDYHKHDPNRPLPEYVAPGPFQESINPPSDAIVLFGDTIQTGRTNWTSEQSFGDCQLHLEFMIPEEHKGSFVDRGNSGVLLMGLYEIQIFDSHPSHKQQIYPDGQCAAVYGETPPLVNACRRPGQWQTYDILFTRPVFEAGKVVRPAMITMLHNGILVHWNTVIHGPMGYREILPYQPHPDKLPLVLQGHKSPVQFRNVWIRPLDEIIQEE